MKYLYFTAILGLTTFLTTPAFADRGHHEYGNKAYFSYAERVERHLDHKGDKIQHRFERKALRAEAKGKHLKADRMRAKGERINRHLDRKGDRLHDYYDRRHRHRHSETYRHSHYIVKPRVVYRNHDLYDTYLGLVFNQPGLSISWGWHD